ncbi:MAG: universal stress protein [Desulfobacterales bacterium]|nr:universal stress protein [Desulfobacterales bacterium]MBL7102639.1 universal stress protein [Desulfobacteraceae bacterium]MBL7174030.1 universal stress protein [Desulfobacteraceae bacterium]MBU0734786.1 universal stress protein [Pseudomonadota bacterium]
MFKNILVPTDFSDADNHALDIAVKLCSIDNGKINLLHVIEIIANTTFEEFEEFYTILEKRSFEDMNEMKAQFQKQVDIVPGVVYGNRAQEILRFAGENGIDLIVMKSHKIDVDDRAQGWGTISYKVGILAQCPVMLVK